MSLNGKLPSAQLKNIPGGKLEKNAANAWLDMRAYIHNKTGLWIVPGGPRSSYRPYKDQLYFWNLYRSGRGNVAAYPGSSHHGWGKAVDVPNYNHQQAILKYGPKFGWSHAEGARVNEPWHFTYIGGDYKRKVNPLAPLSNEEESWVKEYVKLKKANKNRLRRIKLRRVLRQHRKSVYRYAKKHGWTKNLKLRYKILSKYS